MFFSSWLRNRNSNPRAKRATALRPKHARLRPLLEALEDRTVPSGVSFSPPVSYDGGSMQISSVVVADFNGDGKLDIAASGDQLNGSNPNHPISVLMGNGDGTFQNPRSVLWAYGPTTLVVADLNLDGRPDLVASYGWIALGNGDGTFHASGIYTLGSSIVVGDYNGDGKPDLAVLRNTDIGLLLGNGDGTFQPARNVDIGFNGSWYPRDLAGGDFNADGRPDLIVALDGSNVALLGNGEGTFQVIQDTHVPLPFGFSEGSIVVSDFNGDGKQDLAITTSSGVSVRLGNGDGTFQADRFFGAFLQTVLAEGDFNQDGKLDLVGGYFNGYGAPSVYMMLGNGDGTFQLQQVFPAGNPDWFYPNGEPTLAVAVGDFNSDGRPDLAVGHPVPATDITVLMNRVIQSVQIDIKPGNTTNAINLNNDGTLTVALFSAPDFDARTVDVLSVRFAGAAAIQSSLEDVNHDGRLDLLLHFRISDTNLIDVYRQLLFLDAADGKLDTTREQTTLLLSGGTTSGGLWEGLDVATLFETGKTLSDLLVALGLK